jgi:hypothetical protein
MRDMNDRLRRNVRVLALLISAALAGGCTPDNPLGDPTRVLHPRPATGDDIVDPVNPLGAITGRMNLGLSTGSMGVYNEASVELKASYVRATIDAMITARTANAGGGAGTTHVMNQCRSYNAFFCATFDFIPDYCHANPIIGEGAPGATASGIGTYEAGWRDQSASLSLHGTDQCPGKSISYRGGDGSNGSGSSSGQVCHEAWLVYPDGSHPDEYIGTVCFTSVGGNMT